MTAKLVIEIIKDYPNEMDLTSYEGCVTVVQAAQLDKTMMDQKYIGVEELLDDPNVEIRSYVLGEVA